MRALASSSSIRLVLAVGLGWILLTWLAPEWMEDLTVVVPPGANEARIELVEHLLVVAMLVGWIAIVARTSGRARAVAIVMALQVVVLLGEETDWGRIYGLPRPWSTRNLRTWLREHHVISPNQDPDAMAVPMLVFLLTPALPIARVRALWASAAPVRAQPADAAAVVLGLLLFLPFRAALHEHASFEMLQTCEYVVLAVVTARVARETMRMRRGDVAPA